MSEDTTHSNGNADHLKASKNHARQAASEMRDAAADAVRDLRERADSAASDIREKAKDWQQELETYVRENPTKSVLTAAGIGFLVGLIVRR